MSSFVDANIPIYATGGEHLLKEPCVHVLRMIVLSPTSFITDAETLQEILHRYRAIRRLPEGLRTLSHFHEVMQGHIEAMLAADVLTAAGLAPRYPRLEARDLIHLAVMRRLGVTRIISADRGYDLVPDVQRLDPARLDEWRDSVVV